MASFDDQVVLTKGDKAEAKWKFGHKWFNVVVDSVNDDGSFALLYEDGDHWDTVPKHKIRLLNGVLLDPTYQEPKRQTKKLASPSGKWKILRNAILSSTIEKSEEADEASIHRHDGFHMFEKLAEILEPGSTIAKIPSQCVVEGYHVVRYQLPTATDQIINLRILERQVGTKLSLTELAPSGTSHGKGIDNTGNVRVWPAEEILLHVVINGLARSMKKDILNSSAAGEGLSYPLIFPSSFVDQGGKRVLELGGGMTALAGLGLAARRFKSTSEDALLFDQFTFTDGNPSSVSKQSANIELNAPLLQEMKASSHVLFWEKNDESGTEVAMVDAIQSENSKFDLIIGADLLFFESHDALAMCLDRLLVSKGGIVLLCQPSRKGTMEKFSSHDDVLSRFDVKSYDTSSFDPVVASMHQEYLNDPSYDPSIHSPNLLCLTRR